MYECVRLCVCVCSKWMTNTKTSRDILDTLIADFRWGREVLWKYCHLNDLGVG